MEPTFVNDLVGRLEPALWLHLRLPRGSSPQDLQRPDKTEGSVCLPDEVEMGQGQKGQNESKTVRSGQWSWKERIRLAIHGE